MKSKVLFVCMGNICRSPTAEGVFRQMVSEAGLDHEISVESAGTHAYHLDKTPDPRAVAAAAKRGYDLSNLISRQVTADDFRDSGEREQGGGLEHQARPVVNGAVQTVRPEYPPRVGPSVWIRLTVDRSRRLI